MTIESPTSLRAVRETKLKALRARGIDPYPPRACRTHLARALVQEFETLAGKTVAVAGRILAIRSHGKAAFVDLHDASGKIQLYFRRDVLGELYEIFNLLDLGDILGASGKVFKTRTGEVSVEVAAFEVLAKGLRTPPVVKAEETAEGTVTHDDFSDAEKRYRKRYLDMMVNAAARGRVLARSAVARAIRRYLDARGFVEIETPILQPVYGGANARPFSTYHRDLEAELFLRIADELYLKRLLVAGVEKVYEIGKDFRNESIDRTHYPEFTMLEAYEAYGDFRSMMVLTQELILTAASEIKDDLSFSYGGVPLDLRPPWQEISLVGSLNEVLGYDVLTAEKERLVAELSRRGLEVPAGASREKLIDELFDELVVNDLWTPTFVVDFPAALSPLAKRSREKPDLAERFELFICGLEIANAFTEQNDPIAQRRAFEEQARARAAGDEEAQRLDEDFLEALEYGMPPAGGLGLGIDRLAMILTDAPNIREVIAFPQLRPKG